MFEDAFDLETAVVPDTSVATCPIETTFVSSVTQLGCRSAVHRLPVETLAEIFVHCIPPLVVPSRPFILPQIEKPPRHHIRANLARVCRFWCTVLNHEPRVWGTLALDYINPNPEIVSSWLMKSKSCPLDVYIDPYEWGPSADWDHPALPAISKLLYNEFTRIRSLFATDPFINSVANLPTLCGGRTILPRMESLTLLSMDTYEDWRARFSFPRLHTLVLKDFGLLIDGSIQNIHHLDMTEYVLRFTEIEGGLRSEPCWSYYFLQTVPNLVSLTWTVHTSTVELLPRPMVLPFLKFLSLPSCGTHKYHTLWALKCFVAPSLEYLDLDLGPCTYPGLEETLKEALDVICRDGSVQLRHLTLRCPPKLKSVNFRAMSPHLDHLDTFTIRDPSPSPTYLQPHPDVE